MSLTATPRELRWRDLSTEHRRIREQLEESLRKFLCSNEAVPPRAIVGAYGSGKSELLFWGFRKVWEQKHTAFFANLEELLRELPAHLSPSGFTEALTQLLNHQKQVLKNCLHTVPIEKLFLPDIKRDESLEDYFRAIGFDINHVKEALESDRVVVFIDEMEQHYLELVQIVRSSDHAPMRHILQSVEHRLDVPYYLVMSFGLASAYETLGGAEARRKLDLTIPLPNPTDLSVLLEIKDLANFLWWSSRGRPGWAIALSENWKAHLDGWESKPLENLEGFLSHPIDGIPAVDTASITGLTTQSLELFKRLMLQLRPIQKESIPLDSLSAALNELGRDHGVFVSKELVKMTDFMDAFVLDLKALYKEYSSGVVGRVFPEMRIRSYLRKILEAFTEGGAMAFGGWLRGGESFVRGGIAPLVIVLHDLVLEFEGETSEGAEVVDFLYRLGSSLGMLAGRFRDYEVIEKFSNTRKLFGDYYREADIEYVQASFKLVEQLFPRLVVKPIMRLSENAASDIEKQRTWLLGSVSSDGKFLKGVKKVDGLTVEFVLLHDSNLWEKLQNSLFKPIQRPQYFPYQKVIVVLNLDEEQSEVDSYNVRNTDLQILQNLNKLAVRNIEEWRLREFLISYWYNLYLMGRQEDDLFESIEFFLAKGTLSKTARRTLQYFQERLNEKLELLARDIVDKYKIKVRETFPIDDPRLPRYISEINSRIRENRTVEALLCSIGGYFDRQWTLNNVWRIKSFAELRKRSEGYELLLDRYSVVGTKAKPRFSTPVAEIVNYIESRKGFTELLQNILPKLPTEFSASITWGSLTEDLERTPLDAMFPEAPTQVKLLLRALYMTVLLESQKDDLKNEVRTISNALSSNIQDCKDLQKEVQEFNTKLGQAILSTRNLNSLKGELEDAGNMLRSGLDLHPSLLYVIYRFLKGAQSKVEDELSEWRGERGLQGWRNELRTLLDLEVTLAMYKEELAEIYEVNEKLKKELFGKSEQVFKKEIETPLKNAMKDVISGLGSAVYELGDDIPIDKINLDPLTNNGQVVREYVDELQSLGESLDTLVENLTILRERTEEVGKAFSAGE